MSAGLSLEQRRSLQSFQEITQLQDENLCMEILLHNEWDVDRSVEQLLSGRISSPSSHPGTAAARADQQVGATSSNGVFGFLELLFVPLRWLFQSQPLSLNPDQDTVRFVEEFNAKYGSNHAPLVTTSYQTAVATSHAQHKFLVVYLHSPLHEDADNFCSQVLCSSRLTQVLGNDQVLFWAGRVWDPEGYALSSQLRASAFPFLAVLVCQSQRMVQIVTKVQGVTDVEEIASQLQRGMSSFSDVILQNRLTSERRCDLCLFACVPACWPAGRICELPSLYSCQFLTLFLAFHETEAKRLDFAKSKTANTKSPCSVSKRPWPHNVKRKRPEKRPSRPKSSQKPWKCLASSQGRTKSANFALPLSQPPSRQTGQRLLPFDSSCLEERNWLGGLSALR